MLVIICAHTHIWVHVGTHLTVAWRMYVIWYGRQDRLVQANLCMPYFAYRFSFVSTAAHITCERTCWDFFRLFWCGALFCAICHELNTSCGGHLAVCYVWQSLCLLARYTAIIHGMVSLMKSSCSFCSSYLHLLREREKNNRHKTVIASRFSI